MPIPVYYSEVYVKDGDSYHGALAIRGPQGEQGEQGEQGVQGPPGEGLDVIAIMSGATVEEMEASYPAANNAFKTIINCAMPPSTDATYYMSNGTAWIRLANMQGEPGLTPIFGDWPSEVRMQDNTPGTPSATVVLEDHAAQTFPPSPSNYSFVFTFSHLKGEKGDKGDTGAQGGAPALSPVVPVVVVNSSGTPTGAAWFEWDSTNQRYQLNLNLSGVKGEPFTYSDFTVEQLEALRGPRGLQGAKGDKGDPGAGVGTFYYTPLVLISNVEPQNPVNNLLYVQNGSEIEVGFVHVGYTTDKPTFNPDGSSIKAGDVYIMQGDENQHPLVWGNIKVYPLRVWLYDGSQWVAKTAKSYVNNQWYPLNSVWLIDRGKFVTDYTNWGGKITTGTNSVKIRADTNYTDFYFTFGQPITGNIKIHVDGTLYIVTVSGHVNRIGFAAHYPATGASDFNGTTLTTSTYNNFVTPALSPNNQAIGFVFNSACELNITNLWYEIL